MGNIDRAFEIPKGISLNGTTAIFTGSLAPDTNNEVAPAGSIYLRTNGELWQKYGSADNEWRITGTGTSGSANLIEETITQNSHGFTVVPTAIYHNGTNWQKARANSSLTLGTHLVTEITSINQFKMSTVGVKTITSHGLTVDEYYFVSDSVAGEITTSEPTNTTSFSNPILYVRDVNTIEVLNWRPSVVPASTSGGNTLLTGLAGGQTVIGGTGASENLTLESTSNATKGNINVNSQMVLATGVALQGPVGSKITQATHTFTVLTTLYHNGATYVKAQGNAADTCAQYVVISVIDANNFVAVTHGRATITAHGLTVGEYYYLSTSVAGGLSINAPTGIGEYSQPMLYVIDANTIDVLSYRPIIANVVLVNNVVNINSSSVITYNITDKDHHIVANTTTASVNVYLPNPVTFKGVLFKFTKTAPANSLLINRYDVETINGVADTMAITSLGATYNLFSDGTNWWIT